MTNALKYGATKVDVQLAPYEHQYCLTVSDNGKGLPADFGVDKMSGLGMKVITSLVKNLGGSLSHQPNANIGGTAFQIIFSPMLSLRELFARQGEWDGFDRESYLIPTT